MTLLLELESKALAKLSARVLQRGFIRKLAGYQFLFEELVKRDFKKKYKRTVLGLTLCVFFVFCILDHVTFTWRFICLLYPICCLVLLNVGVRLILSALFVLFRDIQYLWPSVRAHRAAAHLDHRGAVTYSPASAVRDFSSALARVSGSSSAGRFYEERKGDPHHASCQWAEIVKCTPKYRRY